VLSIEFYLLLFAIMHHKNSQGNEIVLSFALSTNMSVDSIIGILFIHELAMELQFVPSPHFLAHEITTSFPAVYWETILTAAAPSTTDNNTNTAMDKDSY